MNWYIAALLSSSRVLSGSERPAQQCHYLIEARSHDDAYEVSLELGNSLASDHDFVGIAELTLVPEKLVDGAELLWSEYEIPPTELQNRVHRKDDMRAFLKDPLITGWYICSVVLCEIHDEGSHGDVSLIWENSYLIQASNSEAAYQKAVQIGKQQQDLPGSHRCDGDKAHWEFVGIRDIIPVREIPAPNSLLWCDEFSATSDTLKSMVATKTELAVFKWEAERQRQRPKS
jgi:hypothetical protein